MHGRRPKQCKFDRKLLSKRMHFNPLRCLPVQKQRYFRWRPLALVPGAPRARALVVVLARGSTWTAIRI